VQNQVSKTLQIPLSQLVAREGARFVPQSDAAILITPPGQWHYAAEAAIELPDIMARPRCINLRAEVENGKIGVGWLNADGSGWVTRAFVEHTATPAVVRLDVPMGTRGGRLIIENASEDGRPAVVVLYRLWLSAADQESRGGAQ
jgi:hypothetical protein